MSLFVCEDCGVIENTALSRFWFRNELGGRALCSQCDLTVGKWHGKFPREQYDPERHKVQYKDGEWIRPGGKGELR